MPDADAGDVDEPIPAARQPQPKPRRATRIPLHTRDREPGDLNAASVVIPGSSTKVPVTSPRLCHAQDSHKRCVDGDDFFVRKAAVQSLRWLDDDDDLVLVSPAASSQKAVRMGPIVEEIVKPARASARALKRAADKPPLTTVIDLESEEMVIPTLEDFSDVETAASKDLNDESSPPKRQRVDNGLACALVVTSDDDTSDDISIPLPSNLSHFIAQDEATAIYQRVLSGMPSMKVNLVEDAMDDGEDSDSIDPELRAMLEQNTSQSVDNNVDAALGETPKTGRQKITIVVRGVVHPDAPMHADTILAWHEFQQPLHFIVYNDMTFSRVLDSFFVQKRVVLGVTGVGAEAAIAKASLVMVWQGRRLFSSATPRSLAMTDGAEIDVYTKDAWAAAMYRRDADQRRQVESLRDDDASPATPIDEGEPAPAASSQAIPKIKLKIRGKDDSKPLSLAANATQTVALLISTYHRHRDLHPGQTVRLKRDGEVLDETDTLGSLDLDDGEVLDAVILG